MPTGPRRKKEAEADGYTTSHCFRPGDTEAGADISASASLVRAAEVGLGSWVLGGCEGGQSGQGQKPRPDQRDHKYEGPAGEEMDSPSKGQISGALGEHGSLSLT